MIPFSSIFSVDFFFNLGYALLAVIGLILAIGYRRSQDGKVSLFLLLTTALVATYYTLQWLLGSFISYSVSNYAAAHPDYQFPSWINMALIILFTALNYSFIVTLGLTAWFAIRKSRAENAVLAQGPDEMMADELGSESTVDGELSGTTSDSAAPADSTVPGPEA